MSLEDYSRVGDDGVAHVGGGGKPIPAEGYQPIRFDEGITMDTSPKNDAWCRISLPVVVCEGPDDGKGFIHQMTLTAGGKDESFVKTANGDIVSFLVVLGMLDRFVAALKEDNVDVSEDLFLSADSSGNYTVFDRNKADAVCRKLKGMLPNAVIDADVMYKKEKGDFGTFNRPYIFNCAKYGSGKFKVKAPVATAAQTGGAAAATPEQRWG